MVEVPSVKHAAGKRPDDAVGASFFDVLRAILFVTLGHAANPIGLRRIATWVTVSGREARRAGSARIARARRSPGIGVNRKARQTGREGGERSESAVKHGESGGVPFETVGDAMLQVVVAWKAWVSCAPPTSVATLATDEGTVGPWENKCLQDAVARMQRGRWRREALRFFATECQNHSWSGADEKDPVTRQNVEAVQRWLCQQKAFTWVYEADDVADLLEEGGCRRWRLGDADGRCVGSAIWLSEGHVVRVARGHVSLSGSEGDPRTAAVGTLRGWRQSGWQKGGASCKQQRECGGHAS